MRALLVNPWLCDFKAFDFWMKPVGLLYIASLLREAGVEVDFVDCLDRYQPVFLKRVPDRPATDEFGRGKFYFEEIEKPGPVHCERRRFKRYGMPTAVFEEILDGLRQPDVVLVTSMMSYWYPGVFDTITLLKRRFPGTPVILGGVYATLCTEHARSRSGADYVVAGPVDSRLFKILSEFGPVTIPGALSFSDLPMPAFDLYDRLDYACVLASRGCPFRCSYCGVRALCPEFVTRPPDRVVDEIELLGETRGVRNVAFYDDALLANPDFEAVVDGVIRRSIRANFHTPNGLQCRYITEGLAHKLRRANFRTIYLSLETVEPARQRATGGKVDTGEFERAAGFLRQAGFTGDRLHVYLLIGLPGQPAGEMIRSIDYVWDRGFVPHLAEFSPIPGTDDFVKTGIAPDADPLLHNNCIFPAAADRRSVEAVKNYLAKKRIKTFTTEDTEVTET